MPIWRPAPALFAVVLAVFVAAVAAVHSDQAWLWLLNHLPARQSYRFSHLMHEIPLVSMTHYVPGVLLAAFVGGVLIGRCSYRRA